MSCELVITPALSTLSVTPKQVLCVFLGEVTQTFISTWCDSLLPVLFLLYCQNLSPTRITKQKTVSELSKL